MNQRKHVVSMETRVVRDTVIDTFARRKAAHHHHRQINDKLWSTQGAQAAASDSSQCDSDM